MGAVDYNWGSSSVMQGATSSTPVNNGNWAGLGDTGKTVPFGIPSNNPSFQGISPKTSKQVALEALETAIATSKIPAKYKVALELFGTAYSLLSSWFSTASEDEKDEAKKKMQEASNLSYTLENKIQLEDFISRQQEAMTPPATGETLPSVLTKNAKELVTSVNTLTSTFGDKIDVLNNYMYGLMTYLDIATGFMDKSYTLNKELSDEAKKKEKDNSLQVGDSKMSPAEIEARKNLAMLKAYDFKNTPVSQTVLEAENVVGMTPLEIEASHRSFEVEAKVFAKTPQKVKDWDENELADISPREARLVKDATVAIDTTDKINFELDDEDVDLLTTENIKSIFGYADDSGAIKEMFSRLGGVGLPST